MGGYPLGVRGEETRDGKRATVERLDRTPLHRMATMTKMPVQGETQTTAPRAFRVMTKTETGEPWGQGMGGIETNGEATKACKKHGILGRLSGAVGSRTSPENLGIETGTDGIP